MASPLGQNAGKTFNEVGLTLECQFFYSENGRDERVNVSPGTK